MAAINREAIYVALFNLVAGITIGGQPAFNKTSRRLKAAKDVPVHDQPAFFMLQGNPVPEQADGMPARWILRADLYIYVHGGGENEATPATRMNPILDAICAAFEPSQTAGRQTLGGLVRYCRISGEIQTDEGVLGAQAVAIIPIEMMTERAWVADPT